MPDPVPAGWWIDQQEGRQILVSAGPSGLSIWCEPCNDEIIFWSVSVGIRVDMPLVHVLLAIARHRAAAHDDGDPFPRALAQSNDAIQQLFTRETEPTRAVGVAHVPGDIWAPPGPVAKALGLHARSLYLETVNTTSIEVPEPRGIVADVPDVPEPPRGICLFAQVDAAGTVQAMCSLVDGHTGAHVLMNRAGEYVEFPRTVVVSRPQPLQPLQHDGGILATHAAVPDSLAGNSGPGIPYVPAAAPALTPERQIELVEQGNTCGAETTAGPCPFGVGHHRDRAHQAERLIPRLQNAIACTDPGQPFASPKAAPWIAETPADSDDSYVNPNWPVDQRTANEASPPGVERWSKDRCAVCGYYPPCQCPGNPMGTPRDTSGEYTIG